jgi:PIN domain nuclease of toxin-antitoxin system
MNLLIDTHVLLWWLSNDSTLSREARECLRDNRNTVFVSAASVWEISIKKSIGKLDAPDDLESAMRVGRFRELAISTAHALAAGTLPMHHSDPFDRMLVAQAMLESLTFLTRDDRIEAYSIPTIKA